MTGKASEKPPLLFLAHRIPFPPNKGDKIRSFHILKHLSREFHVFLGTFVDTKEDLQHLDSVRDFCSEAFFVKRFAQVDKLRPLAGFLNNEPLSLSNYRSSKLQRWVDKTVERERIESALAFCSPMFQFIRPQCRAQKSLDKVLVDFVDVDSEKWRQYAAANSFLKRFVFAREGKKLLEYEVSTARKATHSFFVSEAETELFRERSRCEQPEVSSLPNGVDADYFRPGLALENPYGSEDLPIVFTGAMDYPPNIDAVVWFTKHVMPSLLALDDRLRFFIVGGSPAKSVSELADCPEICVTGRVTDVRPYLEHALLAVAPMQIARGIQNKVLEAMAMKKPTVLSPQALEGIGAVHGQQILVADSEAEFVRIISEIKDGAYKDLGESAREYVLANFDWEARLAPLDQFFQHPPIPLEDT
ncbi:MAG: TIGR03087 family PEP-CTERM/XrtA system glycosyltransferase [Pseudomonadota bacterium]